MPGKIDHHLFNNFIRSKCGYPRKEVSAGAGFGVDVSVIDLPGEMAMAMTSDPLSLVPQLGLQESAWLSVHLMANDMATTGYAPAFGQFVLNFPASFSKSDFNIYWDYIHQYCSEIKIAITGGHTGFVEGQNSTIAGGGTLVALAPKNKILLSKMAEAGDKILVTKSCALSSAAILAMSFPETVKQKAGAEVYRQAADSFYQTSSLPDALHAVKRNAEERLVTAMHDVTEGGVLGAIYELAIASGNGVIVYDESLPVGEVQAAVCELFGLDPRYCIGAGSMIITCKPQAADLMVSDLRSNGIACAVVGELCAGEDGHWVIGKTGKQPIIYAEADPYWAAFVEAVEKRLR